MKKIIGVLFLTVAVPVVTDVPPTDSTSIGLAPNEGELSLGESRDSVLGVLREHFHLDELANGACEVSSSRGCLLSECFGAASFKQGRLVSVTKQWEITGPDRGVAVATTRTKNSATLCLRFKGGGISIESLQRRGPLPAAS